MSLARVKAPQLECPACAKPTDHRYLFEKNGCKILQCAVCGLGRAVVAGNFKPDEYYTDDYFSGGHSDGYADYRGAEPVLRREFARTVAFIRKYRAAGHLLDIGCAYGFFLDEAKPFYQANGIEISPHAAESCRRRGLRVVTGMANSESLAEFGPMDVIVMLDVIEHLPDPRQILELCRRHLNRDGIIVITTGNFASLYARLARRHWRLMTPPQHLWYFTPASIARLAGAVGLELEALEHPWKLVPLSLVGFQLRRMIGAGRTRSGRGSGIGVPVNMFDAMRCVLRKAPA
jgi:SAM-dependent methyltransferase